jgi:hypothetical protein
VFGRAAFAVLALALFASLAGPAGNARAVRTSRRLLLGGRAAGRPLGQLLHRRQGRGVAIATLGFASFPAFTVILEGLLFRERIRRNEGVLVVLVSSAWCWSPRRSIWPARPPAACSGPALRPAVLAAVADQPRRLRALARGAGGAVAKPGGRLCLLPFAPLG